MRGPGEDFVSGVLDVVAGIPPGKLMSYGDIAAVLGSRAARAVGTLIARYGSEVPWWRVVRADGTPPICHEGQAVRLLEQKGTPLLPTPSGHRVQMRLARHWLASR